MAKTTLSVRSTYVRTWGLYEGVREILQNARDAAIQNGSEVAIEHLPRSKRLVVKTTGAAIDARALLLGFSSKQGDERTAGEYGEGLKLAFLALVRAGHKVRVETGDEAWTPALEHSDDFGGEQVLVVRRHKLRSTSQSVSIEINDISKEQWDEMRPKFLFIEQHGEHVNVYGRGTMLLDKRYEGCVYVKDIFVQKFDGMRFGYNLSSVTVDRDRRMVDQVEAGYVCSMIMQEASESYEAVADGLYENLKKGRREGANSIKYSTNRVTQNVFARFQAEYGEGVAAVNSEEEAKQIRALGGRAVTAPEALVDAVQCHTGSVSTILHKLAEASIVSVDPDTLLKNESDALWLARVRISAALDIEPPNVTIVEFAESKKNGTSNISTCEIRIARSVLSSRTRTLSVLIHEVAHVLTGAGDGDPRHTAKIEEIWEKVWAKSAGEEVN